MLENNNTDLFQSWTQSDTRPGQVSDLIQLGQFSNSGCKRNGGRNLNAPNAEAVEMRPGSWEDLPLTSTSIGLESSSTGAANPIVIHIKQGWGTSGLRNNLLLPFQGIGIDRHIMHLVPEPDWKSN